MIPRQSFLPILTILTSLMMAVPGAAAPVATNSVTGVVASDNAAVASCQVLVLVNAVIVLELEDGLGLVSGLPAEPARIRVPATHGFSGTLAECRVIVDRLRVVLGDGDSSASYVSGPPPVSTEGTVIERVRVEIDGDGVAVALCQFVILVDSVILGGGPYGFPTGAAPGVLKVDASPAGAASDASCEANVNDVEVVRPPR